MVLDADGRPALVIGAPGGSQIPNTTASVVLRWNAFRGGADQAALAEARALTDELRATRDLATQQVRLEVQRALETLEVAESSLGTARKVADAAGAAGYAMVDAPVSGGIAAANAGTLTFMVGGSDEAFARAEPILTLMGKTVMDSTFSGTAVFGDKAEQAKQESAQQAVLDGQKKPGFLQRLFAKA